MTYTIRRARPADAPGIVDVARRTWQSTYAGIIPAAVQEQALAAWYAEERIARQTADPVSAFLLVTTGAGEIVGFAFTSPRPEAGEAELWRFYVLPEHQGKGLGRRLIAATLEALPVRRLFVQVEKENAVGRRAYEAMGFTLVREYADDLFGHATRAVELCLAVAGS